MSGGGMKEDEVKHTKGPWSDEAREDLDDWNICCDSASISTATPITANGVPVAFAVSVNTLDDTELDANARLIAAAPDLLDALKNLYAMVEGECPSLLEDDINAVRALDAIAKATGAAQ